MKQVYVREALECNDPNRYSMIFSGAKAITALENVDTLLAPFNLEIRFHMHGDMCIYKIEKRNVELG
jgi:hypothetical protein